MRGALEKLQPHASRCWAHRLPRAAPLYASVRGATRKSARAASAGCPPVRPAQMEPAVSSLVERLHLTPHKAVVYATGGGSQASSYSRCCRPDAAQP